MLRGQPDEPRNRGAISPPRTGAKVEWLFDRRPTRSITPCCRCWNACQPGGRPQQLVRVYLICDRQDHPLLQSNRARSLRDHLLGLGFEVRLPLAEGDDAAEFSRDNRTS